MTENQKEHQYLQHLMEKVHDALSDIHQSINLKKEEIDDFFDYMQEHRHDMDRLEKNTMRETIDNYAVQGEHSVGQRKRLFRLLDTPYFGRIDFTPKGNKNAQSVYVGVHNFQDGKTGKNLVYDWRAPISSMFYDYEPGEAQYSSNRGVVKGEVSLKGSFASEKEKWSICWIRI